MSYYSCPVCKVESREKDSTHKQGKLVVRTIMYNCGSIMKVVQDGMSFKSYIDKGEKCLQEIHVKPRVIIPA